MLCYCNKCGNICEAFQSELEDGCYCCGNTPLKPVPNKYIDNFRWRDGDGKQALIEEVIKTSPNFDTYLFKHKSEIIKAKNDDMKGKMAIGKAFVEETSRVPKCPTCSSTNIRKMSGIERGASIATFGLFSKKINKTFKCNGCGYTW